MGDTSTFIYYLEAKKLDFVPDIYPTLIVGT